MTADSQPHTDAQALEARTLDVWLENHQALKRIAQQIVGESSASLRLENSTSNDSQIGQSLTTS